MGRWGDGPGRPKEAKKELDDRGVEFLSLRDGISGGASATGQLF